MRLEANKYYRTRDGRKAFVAAIIPPAPNGTTTTYLAHGYILSGTDWVTCSWRASGKQFDSRECRSDLVEPWRDPVRVVGVVHEVSDQGGDSYSEVVVHVSLPFGEARRLTGKTVTLIEGEHEC